MPKGRKKKRVELKPQSLSEPEDLRMYVGEAEQVELLTRQQGWEILRRDMDDYRERLGASLPYMNPKTATFEDARILYIASDKLIKMVEDYAENRRRAIELLQKIDNPQENIILDVDNTPTG